MHILWMVLLAFLLSVVVVYSSGFGVGNIDRRTVDPFDLQRYMGDWYEIARIDHPFERGLIGVRATYTLLDATHIEVINSGFDPHTSQRRETHGEGVVSGQVGQLRVSFSRFFSADYNVLAVGEAYEWALVGSRSPRYLWILARTPRLTPELLAHIVQLAVARGYKSEKLLWVDQAVNG
ncbi:MAG: lipocalin family protein [Alistipes sp.]